MITIVKLVVVEAVRKVEIAPAISKGGLCPSFPQLFGCRFIHFSSFSPFFLRMESTPASLHPVPDIPVLRPCNWKMKENAVAIPIIGIRELRHGGIWKRVAHHGLKKLGAAANPSLGRGFNSHPAHR